MNFPSKHLRDDDSVESMAAAWLAQRDDGLSPEKATEFLLWRQEDPRHEDAVRRLEAAWSALLELRHFRPEAAVHPDRDLLAPAQPRSRAVPILAWSLAAAAAAAVAVTAWTRFGRGAEQPVYATTDDGFQRVSLSDGSVAELNTATAIQVAYSAPERRVRLLRGEAHFFVAKNKARPFWVEAGGVTVRAVGTAFDVRMADGEVDVIVTEGKVALGKSGAAALDHDSLAAGQRAVIDTRPGSTRAAVGEFNAAQIHQALSWEGPRLVFVASPLSEAVGQFNRQGGVQIELADPALGALPISGSFRPDNAEAFVRLLGQGGDVAVEQTAPGHYRLRKAR